MPEFLCTIEKPSGEVQTLSLTCDTAEQARRVLDGRGYRILAVERERGPWHGILRSFLISSFVVALLAAAGLFAYQELRKPAPSGPQGLTLRGEIQGLEDPAPAIRLLVHLPEVSKHIDVADVRLDGQGRFEEKIPIKAWKAPTVCTVTVGLAGFQTVVHEGLPIAGDPPACSVPATRLSRIVAQPESPPTAEPSSAPAELSPTPGAQTPRPAAPGDWRKARLVALPGQGLLGILRLEEPVPTDIERFLGKPDLRTDNLWRWGPGPADRLQKGVELALEDGGVEKVTIRGLRAATEQGLFVGAPAAQVAVSYPEAQREAGPEPESADWLTPGLVLRIEAGKLVELVIRPKRVLGWRFQRFEVEPGLRAGPLELGRPVSKEALSLLGPPDLQKPARADELHSGLVRWGEPQSERRIELTLHNGRSVEGISSITLRGVRAVTDQDVYIGGPADRLAAIAPDLQEEPSADFHTSVWKLPGLTLTARDGEIVEMKIYSR